MLVYVIAFLQKKQKNKWNLFSHLYSVVIFIYSEAVALDIA